MYGENYLNWFSVHQTKASNAYCIHENECFVLIESIRKMILLINLTYTLLLLKYEFTKII